VPVTSLRGAPGMPEDKAGALRARLLTTPAYDLSLEFHGKQNLNN